MAQHFLSLMRGQSHQIGNVLTATGAPTADFYFQWSDTNTPTRQDCILALEALRDFILSNGTPGAAGVNLPVK